MSFEILESEIDIQIKENLQNFADGDYIGAFTEEENGQAIKLSFFLNHASIEKNLSTHDKLVFTYGDKYLKISIDNSFLKRETYFKYMMDEDFFQNSLKSFIRENRINKVLECL